MIKKKAKVMLPGSITSIVNSVQEGAKVRNDEPEKKAPAAETTEPADNGSLVAAEPTADSMTDTGSPSAESPRSSGSQRTHRGAGSSREGSRTRRQSAAHGRTTDYDDLQTLPTFGVHRAEPDPVPKDRTAPAAKKLPKAEGRLLAREYTIARDSGEDSWQLFLDLARDYKQRDSKLATVYIDSDLKHILDRLKSASGVKLPSTALLSSIVARFVFDHEQDIKDAIYGDSLL